jgi:hypothetical protein
VSPVLAEVVDWAALGEVIVASLVAGVGVTLTFSVMLLGVTRLAELRRDGRPVEAAVFGLIALIGFAVTAAVLVAGIVVMTSK